MHFEFSVGEARQDTNVRALGGHPLSHPQPGLASSWPCCPLRPKFAQSARKFIHSICFAEAYRLVLTCPANVGAWLQELS